MSPSQTKELSQFDSQLLSSCLAPKFYGHGSEYESVTVCPKILQDLRFFRGTFHASAMCHQASKILTLI
jgi:hypothetical protein